MSRIQFNNGSVIESIASHEPIRGKSANNLWVWVDDKEETDHMRKIQLTDNMMDILKKMSEGNLGALSCLMLMVQKKDWYFPDTEPLVYLCHLDDLGLYGEKLFMLWNDCCDRDLNVLETVLRNYQCGELRREDILSKVSGGRGQPFEGLVPMEELFPKGE